MHCLPMLYSEEFPGDDVLVMKYRPPVGQLHLLFPPREMLSGRRSPRQAV